MDSNLGEIICEAVDTIVSKRLEGLKYNTTKICTIVNIAYRQIGRYTVQEENLRYEAYSTDTSLNLNDKVTVMIPNADYNEQKIILNKISTDEDLTSSVAYISPLKKIIKFSDNIINNSTHTIVKDTSSKDQTHFSLLANGSNKVGYLDPEVITYKWLYSIDWSGYNNYSKLGISADFQTWLKDLGATSGNYGLELLFYTSNSSIIDQENKDADYRFTFSINDILGNPYDFPMYFTQEKVIDISHLKDIQFLDIYFYQSGNFRTETGEYIINSEPNEGLLLPDNLFVGNMELYVGHDISAYSGDSVSINTSNILTFSKLRNNDKKTLSLYWIRKIDDSNYEVIDGAAINENKEAYTINGVNINDIDAEVYWVRQSDTESDLANMDIVGANWVYKESELQIEPTNKFSCTLTISENNGLINRENIRLKAVLRVRDENGNWVQYDSNIITLSTEDASVDDTTYNAIMGLSIYCDDGGYQGNYFIYGADNKIIDESKGSGHNKYFKLQYNGVDISEGKASIKQEDIESISWSVWKNTAGNTSMSMINYPDIKESDYEGLPKRITYSQGVSTQLKYNISDVWYPNISENTLSCSIILKNGLSYKASKELIFGKANSQGSNFNLVIEYKDSNKSAYEVTTNENGSIIKFEEAVLIGRLYDLNGPITITEDSPYNWSWSLLSGSNISSSLDIFNLTNSSTQEPMLQLKSGANIRNNYTVLRAICTLKKDADGEAIQTITAYKPIAIRTRTDDSLRCNTMAGASTITYNSTGKPQYYTGDYILYDTDGKAIEGLTWETTTALVNGKPENGLPQLKDSGQGNKALSASPVHIEGSNYRICVVAKKDDIVYWTQPIHITQSNYDLAIVNDWDGTTDIDDGSTIKTSAVAAGRKNDNGTFSGIVLGEVDVDGDGNTDTGLYGMSNGNVTFYLTDKGQATFKSTETDTDGNDIITQTLLGNVNQILSHTSPVYDGNGHETGCSNQFLIDIDQRLIDFRSDSSKNQGLLLSTGNPYLLLRDSNEKEMLKFNTNNFIIQSPGWDTSGLKFDVKNGIINLSKNYYIAGKSTGKDYYLSIGDLQVGTSGTVYHKGQTLEDYINSLIDEALKEDT